MTDSKELTIQERLLAHEFLNCLDEMKAAKAAGYSSKIPRSTIKKKLSSQHFQEILWRLVRTKIRHYDNAQGFRIMYALRKGLELDVSLESLKKAAELEKQMLTPKNKVFQQSIKYLKE